MAFRELTQEGSQPPNSLSDSKWAPFQNTTLRHPSSQSPQPRLPNWASARKSIDQVKLIGGSLVFVGAYENENLKSSSPLSTSTLQLQELSLRGRTSVNNQCRPATLAETKFHIENGGEESFAAPIDRPTSSPASNCGVKLNPHPQALPSPPMRSNNMSTGISAAANRNANRRRSKWATAAEIRGGPPQDRYNKRGGSNKDAQSNHADFGWGNDGVKLVGADLNYELADWKGDWAPPPADWEDRGTYNDPKMTERIHEWEKRTSVEYHIIKIEMVQGEIAPHSWIPNHIDGEDPHAWWRNHTRSPDVMENSKPWWKHYTWTDAEHLDPVTVPDARLDPLDNDMGRANQQTSEHSIVTHENMSLRRAEFARKEKQRQRAADKAAANYIPPPNPYAPRINIYLRPAGTQDISQITDIYNHYIETTVCCPELEPLTTVQVRGRWTDVNENRLPFLVAVDASSKGSRRYGSKGQGKPQAEHIVGFAFADDYNEMRGMYRYTVEVEMFVKSEFLEKGVGRCLMDKLMSVMDPLYTERGGYEFDGDATQYGSGGKRVVGSIIINIPHDSKDKGRLVRLQNWLSQWDFEQAGELFEVGHKLNTIVSQAILIKKTGSTIQPWAL